MGFRPPQAGMFTCIYKVCIMYFNEDTRRADMKTNVRMTSIRLDLNLANRAVRMLGANSRSEAIHMALREVLALEKFKALMQKHGGKMRFSGHEKSDSDI